MARYSTFKYSDQKYGASVNTNLLWAFKADWDNDGVFNGENEAGRVHKLAIERGDDYMISSTGNGFNPHAIGSAIITLDNYDGRYDPYNTDGDLYGLIKPGLLAQIWLRNGIGGTDYDLFTGIIRDIIPYGRRETVDIILEDGWRWLADREVSVALQEGIIANTAIDAIADAAAYPWDTSLENGPDTINYWWASGKKAKSEIEDVANSGIGITFVAADGALTYYSRQRNDDPVFTIQEGHLLKDISIPQPWEFQRNIIKIKCRPRVEQSSQNLWTMNGVPSLGAGKSIEVWASFTYDKEPVPAADVVTPVATTDYTANASADGGGANKTAQISVAIEIFAESAKLTITNNDAGTVYITLLKVRGKPINAPDTTYIIEEGSEAAAMPRELVLDLPWQQDVNIGLNLTEYLLGFLEDPQPFPTVFIEGRPEIQFGLELYDKVSLRLNTWGVDQNFRVGKIKHHFLSETGQLVRTELKLFPVYESPVANYWYIGAAGLSELGVTTYLGV